MLLRLLTALRGQPKCLDDCWIMDSEVESEVTIVSFVLIRRGLGGGIGMRGAREPGFGLNSTRSHVTRNGCKRNIMRGLQLLLGSVFVLFVVQS